MLRNSLPVRRHVPAAFCLVALAIGSTAAASDACSRMAIVTAANVSVSDGSSFGTRSYFHSRDAAAIRHIGEGERIVAVEGPFSWTGSGQDARLGGPIQAGFALGHQFHAFLWHFDELVDDLEADVDVVWAGSTYRGRRGRHRQGGSVSLIETDDGSPILLIDNPDAGNIVVRYDDWREQDGRQVPFLVSIDDGVRVFDYRFSRVEFGQRSPLWFFEAVTTPSIDEVDIYRLHRRLLAAHCLGDADTLADLSTPETIVAGRGKLEIEPRERLREQFTGLFERLDYTGYRDLVHPVIEVSAAGDLGWIAVNVRATGQIIASGEEFDDQWAWIMTVSKIDGAWSHAGNASNYREK